MNLGIKKKLMNDLSQIFQDCSDHPDEFVQKMLFLRKQPVIKRCFYGENCRYIRKSSSTILNVNLHDKYGNESSYASLRTKICKYIHPGESNDQYYKRIIQD